MRKFLLTAAALTFLTMPAVAENFEVNCGNRGTTVIYEPRITSSGEVFATQPPQVIGAICNSLGRHRIVLDGSWYGAPDVELRDVEEVKKFIEVLDGLGAKARAKVAKK